MTHPTPLHDRRYQPVDPGTGYAEAAARLAATFAPLAGVAPTYRVPASVTTAEAAVLAGPPTQVPSALLARFAIKAGTTWGSADDLRRVAPELLVRAADHALPLDRSVLWEKLTWAGWPTAWSADEVAAVHGFLRAEWARLLRSEPRPGHVAHRWLAQVVVGVDDLRPFLDDWHDALGPLTPPVHHGAAVGHLVALLTASALRPDLPDTVADLVPGHPAAATAITDWLVGPGTAHELRRASDAFAGTVDSRRVALAAERLRRFRAAVAQAAVDRAAEVAAAEQAAFDARVVEADEALAAEVASEAEAGAEPEAGPAGWS